LISKAGGRAEEVLMVWVAILMAFGLLLGAVTMLAIIMAVWLGYGGEGNDWVGELQAGYDGSTAKPEVDYSAASPGPHYHLVLLNDDTHTYQYEILMLRDVFGIPTMRGFALARQIDEQGRAVVFTGSLDRVNDKRTQVLAYGPDQRARSKTVEPLGVVIEKAG
jgi:ATP-dependent Clp protease adaptor protein ClpS